MSDLHKRLTAIEEQRPDGYRTIEQMSDGELIGIITGARDSVITDGQLVRLAQGATWADVDNE